MKSTNMFSEKYPLLQSLSSGRGPHSTALFDERYRAIQDLLRSATIDLPHGPIYLNLALHDSRVSNIEAAGTTATIWVNDYQTHCFCHALGNYYHDSALNWDTVFPLGIRFHDLRAFSVSRINKNSKILPLSNAKYLPHLTDFLYDEVLELAPRRQQIGILFATNRYRSKGDLLLEVTCSQINFIEQQRDQLLSLTGDKYINLFDKFWEARCNGNTFDLTDSLRFIEQFNSTAA